MQILDSTGLSSSSSSVRLYDPERDKDDFVHVFKDTASAGLQRPHLLAISSYIWCHPYIYLHPEFCFALATIDPAARPPRPGRYGAAPEAAMISTALPATAATDETSDDTAVGYILCAPSTLPFLDAWENEFLPTVVKREGVVRRPNGDEDSVPGEWDRDRAMALRRVVWHPRASMIMKDYPRLLEDYPAHLHIDILAPYRRHGSGRALMQALLDKLRDAKVKGIHLTMDADNDVAGAFYKAVEFRTFEPELGGAPGGRITKGGVTFVRRIE